MDALARMRFWRSAVTRVMVSGSGLLLCLCLSGCGRELPFIPTPGPSPVPTRAPFPQEALQTSWELEYVLVNGERLPPYHEGQCLAVSARPEQYYFYDGCNHGYCDTMERRSESSKGDTRVLCSITVAGCVEGTPDPNGQRKFVEWDKPFHEAVKRYSRAELRDGALWLTTHTGGERTLVFKQMAGPCKAQAGYLGP